MVSDSLNIDDKPSVKVKCPAAYCSFNVKGWCAGKPWIDMGLFVSRETGVGKVECLDYVDERELQEVDI